MAKVGDLFEITLSNNRIAIGHYVFWDAKNGPFIQVFDCITTKETMVIEEAIKTKYMFPPIVTGLKAALREGLWHIVGKKPVNDFTYPKFISSHWNEKTGEVLNWFLYDGRNFLNIGPILHVDYKVLEYLVVWSPYDVIHRIETGIVPFPYGEMIKKNKFTPINSLNPK